MSLQRCPRCGTLNAADDQQCSRCGRHLAAGAQRRAEPDRAPATGGLPPKVWATQALGMGVLAGALLFAVIGVVAKLLRGFLLHGALHGLPSLHDFVGLMLPPLTLATPSADVLPPLLHIIATGALVGALVAALTAFTNARWAAIALPAVLLVLRRLLTFAAYDSWFWFERWYGATGRIVYVCAALLAIAACGAAVGYVVSTTVRRHLRRLVARPSG